jgi:ATP-dependent protease ClpP protease subunit
MNLPKSVPIVGFMRDHTVSYFERHCCRRGYGDISIYINSTGGCLNACREIVEIMNRCQTVTAYVYGVAYSAAFIILQSATYRFASECSTVMGHYPAYDVGLYYRVPRRQRIIKDDPFINNFLKNLSLRTGLPESQLRVFFEEEKRFKSRQALNIGLLDDII